MVQLSVLLEKGVWKTFLLLPLQKYQRHLWNHPHQHLESVFWHQEEDLLLTGPHTSEDIEDEPRESLEKDTANEDINEEPTKILEDDTVNELVKLVKDIAVKSGDSYTEIQLLRESITTLV